MRGGKYLSQQGTQDLFFFINDKQGALELTKPDDVQGINYSQQQIRCLLISKSRNG